MRCPGYAPTDCRGDQNAIDKSLRLAAEGTARQWHLSPVHPHLFCGCGSETDTCHAGRCCQDDDWGQCRNCGNPAPDVTPEIPEGDLTDPLFDLGEGA